MGRFSLGIALWSQSTSWDEYLAAAKLVDRLGYDSLWTWDHLHAIFGSPELPIFEGYVTLGAWATATEQVRLGLMVGANTFRNPGVVVKSITTLDHASGGRAILGIGGAWYEHEHRAHGLAFGRSPGERLDWLDEAAGAMRTLLDGGTVTSPPDGHYAFDELRHAPGPVQAHVPIMIGGGGRRKTLRTTARYADQWNGFGTPDEFAELDGVLDAHCADVGRDPATIERTINLWLVIRDDPAEARRTWDAQMRHNGSRTDERKVAIGRPLLGSVDQVAARIREYVAAGATGAIVELPAPFDVETIERLKGDVEPLLAG